MNINAILRGFRDSVESSRENLITFTKKLDNERLLIGCPYQLYRASHDLLTIQEKVEFFLKKIEGCDYSKMSEKDFEVYMQAMEEEFLMKSDFQKRYVNENRGIK